VATSEAEATRTKTAYIAELEGLVTKMQGEINLFLTERMEEDKKASAALGSAE
jgi:Gon7 family